MRVVVCIGFKLLLPTTPYPSPLDHHGQPCFRHPQYDRGVPRTLRVHPRTDEPDITERAGQEVYLRMCWEATDHLVLSLSPVLRTCCTCLDHCGLPASHTACPSQTHPDPLARTLALTEGLTWTLELETSVCGYMIRGQWMLMRQIQP